MSGWLVAESATPQSSSRPADRGVEDSAPATQTRCLTQSAIPYVATYAFVVPTSDPRRPPGRSPNEPRPSNVWIGSHSCTRRLGAGFPERTRLGSFRQPPTPVPQPLPERSPNEPDISSDRDRPGSSGWLGSVREPRRAGCGNEP